MDGVGQLKQEIAGYLRKRGLGDADVVTEFPAGARSFPLRAPLAVVGIASVELRESGLGGYFGEGAAASLYGRMAEVCVAFRLYCPAGAGGEGVHGLWEALCDVALDGVFGFYRMEAGKISFDRDSGANVMEAKAWLRGGVAAGVDGGRLEEFVVRKTVG